MVVVARTKVNGWFLNRLAVWGSEMEYGGIITRCSGSLGHHVGCDVVSPFGIHA